MVQTISVLALDAADYKLLKKWECENILLKNDRELQTFSYTYDRPYTREVWATVATGMGPKEHGIAGRSANWDNRMLDFASSTLPILSTNYRSRIGSLLTEFGFDIDTQELSTTFDSGMVTQWPGITDETHFSEAREWLSLINEGHLSESELRNRLLGNTGMELGWLAATAQTDLPITGTHAHILDVAGHVYSSRPDKLKQYYKIVDEMVGIMIDCCDEVVILSDHGMEVSLLDDPDPGKHSWRAFISSTRDSTLPNDVLDVRDWLTEIQPDVESESVPENLDAPEEHLKALGYF